MITRRKRRLSRYDAHRSNHSSNNFRGKNHHAVKVEKGSSRISKNSTASPTNELCTGTPLEEEESCDDDDSSTTKKIVRADGYAFSRRREYTYMSTSCKRVAADPSNPFKLVAPTTQRLRSSLIADIQDAWGDFHEEWLPLCAKIRQLQTGKGMRLQLVPAEDWDTRILKALKCLSALTRDDIPRAHKAVSRALSSAEDVSANEDLTPLALRQILYEACASIEQEWVWSSQHQRSLRSRKRKRSGGSKPCYSGECDPDDDEDLSPHAQIKEEHGMEYESDSDNIVVASAKNESPVGSAPPLSSTENDVGSTNAVNIELQRWQGAVELAEAEEEKAKAQLALALARIEVVKLRNQASPAQASKG